ncbi:MAG TPA: TetR/AcrR family transcriptional regulator [Verrucomicrobiae bacterium]|nr:TetR/AcrR family transcriptional regulator [Verrucomicrobiae bacterium]
MKQEPKPRPPRAGKRDENKAETKKRILAAALDLFSKKGFYQTTTKEISTKAKIAEGTLFNYFKTKEDLALYFFELEVDGLIKWYGAEERLESASLPERLFAIIHRHLERITPYEDFIGAVYLRALQPVSKLNPLSLEHQELSIRYLRFIRGILEEAEGQEEIPAVGDLGAYGFGLFHMAIISYWLHDKSDGKEATLALLDRSLKVAGSVLRKGGWEW